MTITYLIGNGFDIGLNLKTDYRSFIDWYLAKSDVEPPVEWMRGEMRQHPDTWGDAEIAFGKLKFGEHGESPLPVFHKCYDAFTEAFNEYIVGRNNLFEITKVDRRKTAEEFLGCAINLHEYMSSQCRTFYLDQMNLQSVEVNFLTFNYTNTLEQILDFHPGRPNEYSVQVSNNRTIKVVVKSLILYCKVPRSAVEIMTLFGRSDRTKFKKAVLNSLMSDMLLEYTIPDKPNSRLQKYRLTAKGRRLAASLTKKGRS